MIPRTYLRELYSNISVNCIMMVDGSLCPICVRHRKAILNNHIRHT